MVTVPIGTYDPTVVDVTMATIVSAINVEIETRVANGFDQVKSEVLAEEADHLLVTGMEELKSFTRG
jgi:hypothetical protein